jgi:hypothetical protein
MAKMKQVSSKICPPGFRIKSGMGSKKDHINLTWWAGGDFRLLQEAKEFAMTK